MKSKSATLNKKAQISPVFKYIFVLVVGAIILIFFLRLAFFTEKGGEQLIKIEVLHALDTSLQAFSVSGHSSGTMPTPPWPKLIHLKFETEANCGKFRVEGQKYSKTIERVIFGPSDMKTKQLQAWTLSWNFPFRITNLFFLVNPQRSKYYLIYDGTNENFIKSISSQAPITSDMEHFPKNFGVISRASEPTSIPSTVDMVKVNHFRISSDCPSSIGPVSEKLKRSCIKYSAECEDDDLSSDELYKCYGTVTFYDESTGAETETLTFIGREMMFGAIMADSYEAYKCQYERALDELKRMTNLYKTKATKLRVKLIDCPEYSNFILTLTSMHDNVEDLKTNPTYIKAGAFSSYADSVKNSNQNDIAGDGNCEMVF